VADNKPFYAPNGKRVVKLTTHRFEQHNPGEVAGFEDDVAKALIEKGFAVDYQPTEAELAQAGIKPTPPPADATKKDGKPAAK
jgi:hypothetical protein